MINFVSNLPPNLRTGGFSGMNAAAFTAISKLDDLHYAGPINPPIVMRQKMLSKLLRMTGRQGNFFFFSQKRLRAIADEVQSQCSAKAQLDFFHGFTPWILTEPRRPYMAWSDCAFGDYVDIYHRREHFCEIDIERIEQAEMMWLKRADAVLFTSEWSARRVTSHYALDPDRVHVVGVFGEIGLPMRDNYTDSKQFVFISTHFESKGGRTVLSAFRKVKKIKPDASLVVVGDHPPEIMSGGGIHFTGFLRKENPQEHAQLCEIFSRVRALVHPTKQDISPLVIVEAGYFGCPVISSRKFAIPELIDNRRSGILLENPEDVGSLVSAMLWMLERDTEYRQMRQAAWDKAHGEYSKKQFEERLISQTLKIIVKDSSAQI